MHNTKRTHTDKQVYLQQFLQAAITHKLSAGAIFLWQYIYFIAAENGTYSNLYLRSAELQDALSISRTGLQKVRHALAAAGLLNVRIGARQQMYYTLMIDGETIQDKPNTNIADADTNKTDSRPKWRTKPYMQPSEDILADNTYRQLIAAFCARYDNADAAGLATRLLQFFHRRKQQGKTLTRAGLAALLDNLVRLAGENVRAMLDIIRQSIERGWSGFYPYKPVGTTACNIGVCNPSAAGGRIPKYDSKKEDLDFLEW